MKEGTANTFPAPSKASTGGRKLAGSMSRATGNTGRGQSGILDTPRKRLFQDRHGIDTTMADGGDENEDVDNDNDHEQSDDAHGDGFYRSDSEGDDEGMSTRFGRFELTAADDDDEGWIGPDHPSVPKAQNNMPHYKQKSGPEGNKRDPNGRVRGRQLVLWHRKFSFFQPINSMMLLVQRISANPKIPLFLLRANNRVQVLA